MTAEPSFYFTEPLQYHYPLLIDLSPGTVYNLLTLEGAATYHQ